MQGFFVVRACMRSNGCWISLLWSTEVFVDTFHGNILFLNCVFVPTFLGDIGIIDFHCLV